MHKHNYKILFCLFIVVIHLLACNLEKRIQKDQKKLDRIGKLWLKSHPCANDSSFVYVPGKADSFYVPIVELVPDTIQTKLLIDSLVKLNNNCEKEIKSAYASGYAKSSKDWKAKLSQTKIVTRVDTIKIAVKDKQVEKILQQDCTDKQQEINELKIDAEKLKRKSDKWLLWFLISCMAFIISHGFKLIKERFK